MISQRERGELARFYTVTDPKKHQKGYTVYKVTARIISRKSPEDVQEITVWKRYSDFRKLHRDLWQLHRNLCSQSELFPPFAKAKVFGRFEDTVIEERRQCSEDLLQFSANIPALYSSQHIQDFFKGGEVHDGSELIGPAQPFSDFLADSLSDCSSEAQKDISGADDLTVTSQSEYGGRSSDSDLTSLAVDTDSLAELDDGMASGRASPNQPPPPGASSAPHSNSPLLPRTPQYCPTPPAPAARPPPFPGSLRRSSAGGGGAKEAEPDYLAGAGELVRLAAQSEEGRDYRAALALYRRGVDLLLQGVQGEPSSGRREAVKRRTAEYLMRAELISSQHLRSNMGQGSTLSMEAGAQCGAAASRGGQQSPAEELSLYRVLGVIDKVLLVTDKRTQETFILKGLRRSSACSRARRTIMPRDVPHMVRLRKVIVSEDTVFLLLRYAEGGKLWSHVGSFLQGSSPEDSFDIPFIQKSHTAAVCSAQPGASRQGSDSASSGSLPGAAGSHPRGQGAEEALTALPQRRVPSPGSTGGPGGHLPDSGATSEEECTDSYLTLCNEYEQEKEGDEGEGGVPTEQDVSFLEVAASPPATPVSPRSRSLPSNDNLCSPASAQELRLLTERTPMELFSIDSVDSAGEGAWCSDPAPSSKPLSRGRSCSKGDSDDSVPVISFMEAAGEAEVRPPDLLVNLPGVVGGAAEAPEEEEPACLGACPAEDAKASPTFIQPDVLQSRCRLKGVEPTSERELLFGQEVKTSDKMADSTVCSGEDLSPPSSGTDVIFGDTLGERPRDSLGSDRDVEPESTDSDRVKNQAASAFLPEPDEGEEAVGVAWGMAGGGAEGDTSRLFAELDELSLASRPRLPEEFVRRWGAEMVSALDGLHQEGVVCGDLNPNNILLTHQGHVELTYFCSWSEVEDSYDRKAITNMYCAPEVGGITEETEACDWWSLGAILFELLTGKSLLQCHPAGISRHTALNVPESVSEEAKSLLEQLLQYNPAERLGVGVAGVEDIKAHPFFARVDWSK